MICPQCGVDESTVTIASSCNCDVPATGTRIEKRVTTKSVRLYGHNHGLHTLEPYYSAHVSAMTTEALFSKSDIAAELAYRDRVIDETKACLDREERNNADISTQLVECEELLERLLTCADNGYDTAELHSVVEDARKLVG